MSDVIVHAGRDRALLVTATRPDENGIEQPIDLTVLGTAMFLTAKLDFDDVDGEAIISKSVGVGIALNSPVSAEKNLATVQLEPDDFDLLAEGKVWVLYYDVVLQTVAFGDETIQAGLMKVLPRVRRQP